jgi:CBS-domain-containing membrane protein
MSTVRYEMTSKVTFARETDDIQQAHQSMRALGVRHVPVTRNGHVVGILSDRDILLHARLDEQGTLKVPGKKVAEVMTKEVITCRDGDSVADCIDSLLRHRINALPVVDSAGKLLGIVTSTDLLRLLKDKDWEPRQRLPFKWETIPLLKWASAQLSNA